MSSPVVVDFPLRGAWFTPNTPGTKVPSHGTDLFGERYAYDFVGIDPHGQDKRFYRAGALRYLVFGVRLQDCFGWGQPIYSTTAGTVLRAEDGLPERDPVHIARDLTIMIRNGRAVNANQPVDYHALAGNFIIVESSEGYVVYAHAQTGSIGVAPGDRVVPGQPIARVGHSGNSTAPHLHFQIMDHPDPLKAQGIPCCFRDYEVFEADAWQRGAWRRGAWRRVQNGIPKATERLRKD